MNIVVVESPAKAKTINKYLGSGYKVLASFGHIRDLPAKNGSVDPEKLDKYPKEDSISPMIDSALGLAIVFDGCIYNFRALRAELQDLGYRFFSEGDTEVILKLIGQTPGADRI